MRPLIGKMALASTFAVLMLAPVAARAQGKGPGIEVRAVKPKLVDTTRGRVLSVSFRVTNNTATAQELIETLALPSGWLAIVPDGSFVLRADETTTRVAAFQVSLESPAGPYDVRYGVRAQRDPAVHDEDTVSVAVTAITRLELVTEDKPDSVYAGEADEMRVRLANTGNRQLAVALRVGTDDGYQATVEPATVTLAPAETAALSVRVRTYGKETRPRTNSVRLRATPAGGSDREVAALVLAVEVIPRVTAAPDLYRRLPAEATLRVSGTDGAVGAQVEVRGGGAMDAKGTRWLDFLLRTPDTQASGTYALCSEYSLNYLTPGWRLRAGDQSYGLSQLTSYSDYGRGLQLGVGGRDHGGSADAYFVQQRWTTPAQREYGATAGYSAGSRLSVRVNALRREQSMGSGVTGYGDSLWSIECQGKPLRSMNLGWEYAVSHTNREGAIRRSADAWRVELDGVIGRDGYYRASWFRANPDYDGYYRNSDFVSVSLSHSLTANLRAHADHSRYASNLDLRPSLTTAPREAMWQAGLSYQASRAWSATLDVDCFRRYDRMAPATFDYREDALRAGVGWSGSRLAARLDLRVAEQRDRLAAREVTAWGSNLFVTWRPNPDATFTFYGGLNGDGALDGSRLLGQGNNLGASVAWKPTPKLDLKAWYSKYNFAAADRPQTDQYRFALSYVLENQHRLAVEVRHNTRDVGSRDTSYLLVYTIPFGLPVGKRHDVGALRGRIADSDTPGQPGLAGVYFHIEGATAVSDAKGEFVFPAVPAGEYRLAVDGKSIGLDRIVCQKVPVLTSVRVGQTAHVELSVCRAVMFSGRVMLIPPSPPKPGEQPSSGAARGDILGNPADRAQPTEPTGLPNVLVELASGSEVLRRVTDQKGAFDFDALRPGAWHLKVHNYGVPRFYAIETPEQDLALEAGQRRAVVVNVRPRSRGIEWIDPGGVLSPTTTAP